MRPEIKNLLPGRKTRVEIQCLQQSLTEFKATSEAQAVSYTVLEGKTQSQSAEIETLRHTAEMQALMIDDIETAQRLQNRYVANEYKSYRAVIKAIAEKYDGIADWGVLQTGNIIDVRASFIIGEGLAISAKDQANKAFAASKESEFIKAFLEYNKLDREMPQEHAKEAEVEGCALFRLMWVDEDQNVRVEFISRNDTDYTIKAKPGDYGNYETARWTREGSSIPEVLEAPEFVYGRFAGRLKKINEPYPKVGKCLAEIEALSKALRDWREINHLFAAPVPTIKCKDSADVAKTEEATAGMNWKTRKLLILAGELFYAQPNLGDGAAALASEIVTLAKMISGTTGVPVHFLGLPDLMSNRATADNLMELVAASTRKERMTWIGVYQEMIEKAIALRNEKVASTPLATDTFKVNIPFITAEAWQRIIDIWIPLFDDDAISQETLLAQVPGVDVDKEVERKKVRAEETLERFRQLPPKKDDETDDEEKDETDEEV